MDTACGIRRPPLAAVELNVLTNRPKVVLFTVDGPYQRILASLLDKEFDLRGIVIRYRVSGKRTLPERMKPYLQNPLMLYRYLVARIGLPRYASRAGATYRACFGDPSEYPPRFPESCDHIRVPDINLPAVGEFVRKHDPDIVCVNGTNLIREPLVSEGAGLALGMINLHSGLSPYTRGGNCNLFALADGRPEWVGMTVHHIDPGIDSGDIILTARPALFAHDNYEDVEYRSFGLGIRMMAEAVRRLATGRAERVPQWEEGRLYLARTGYEYSPWKRLQVNRLLNRGLIREYLDNKTARDAAVRLVGDFDASLDSEAA